MIRVLSVLIFLYSGLLYSQDIQVANAKEYLKAHADKYAITHDDINKSRVSDYYYSKLSNSHFVYLQQQIYGIDVFNAVTPLAITDDNKVINSSIGFIPDVSNKIMRSVEALSPREALDRALNHLNIPNPEGKFSFSKKRSNLLITEIPELAFGPVLAEKIYFPRGEEMVLSWRIEIDSKYNSEMMSIIVDAEFGKIIHEVSHTIKCGPEGGNNSKPGIGYNEFAYQTLTKKSIEAPSGRSKPNNLAKGDGAQYRAYPYYLESPEKGNQQLIVDPADSIASPFGWHDTDGRTGPETQITRGNNIHSFQDRNDTDSSSGDEPNGGPDLVFDIVHDPALDVTDNIEADVTQLFYMGNAVHDWSYKLGFDEASGNYQENNLSRGGNNARDGDPVLINALDGFDTGEIDNANFTQTSDGRSGRMQLYNWQARGKDLIIENLLELNQELFTGIATFGPGRVTSILESNLIIVDDEQNDQTDACQNIQNSEELNGNIALIRRGTCFFSEKIYNAQLAGAVAAIVCNNQPDEILNMRGATNAALVNIPGYFITKEDCDPIEAAILNGTEITAKFVPNPVKNISSGFDNGIVAHEYSHGISTRLSGGPLQSTCLSNDEQMGEGWSDFFRTCNNSTRNRSRPNSTGSWHLCVGNRTRWTGHKKAAIFYRY